VAYVTIEDLKESLADAGGAGARTAANLEDPRLQANLDEATGEVTGRLTRSYELPDPGEDPATSPGSIPALLRTIILGIAGYLATLEFYGSQPVEERDPVVLRYARARELLTQVARGDLTVEGVDPKGDSSPSGEPAIYQGVPSLGVADSFNPALEGRRLNAPPYFGGATWE
jgi:phage gp36-like protein